MFSEALFLFYLCGQSVDSLSPSAPTLFGSDLDMSKGERPEASLNDSPGIFLGNYGGIGKAQTISIRGAKASDVSVSLEGVPLNSPTSGEFDFANLSFYGLSEGKILRGGYSPYSTNPSGQILFKLPRENISQAEFGVGSYQSFSLGIQTPVSSFYFDQSENDFPYDQGGTAFTRSHNASQRLNFRTWKRMENQQIWAQVLYSDQDLPGPLSFLSDASSQTLTPTLAYQGYWKIFEWTLWGSFQRQAYSDSGLQLHTLNRSWSTGIRDQARFAWTKEVQMEISFEWTQDKLYSEQSSAPFKSTTPLRQILSAAIASYINLSDSWLLHPQLRGEFVSDLPNEHFSIHPGIGSRLRVGGTLDLLANFSFISRAPNFNEMYTQISGLSLANPNLERQRSIQGDVGFEVRGKIGGEISGKFQQALFIDRTEGLLQSVNIGGSGGSALYQVQNIGTSLSYGLENKVSLDWTKFLRLQASYTLQSSKVSDHQRDYQPIQHLQLSPQLFPDEWINFTLPLYARSSVRAGTSSIGPQWDLGLKTDVKIKKMGFRLELFNLLGWNREELKDFPLSNETSVKLSSSFTF